MDSRRYLALILGASQFPGILAVAQNQTQSAALLKSKNAIARLLGSPKAAPRYQVESLFNSPDGVAKQVTKIDSLIKASGATDVLIYYIGHGDFLRNTREYYLALRSTKTAEDFTTGFTASQLSAVLANNIHNRRIYVILDCCFAGAAVKQFQAGPVGEIVERATYKVLPSNGTALLVAASKNELAMSPAGHDYTMFTGGLVHVLDQGLPGRDQLLSLDEIAEELRAYLVAEFGEGAPLPEIHSPRQRRGNVAKAPLFANRAYATPPHPADGARASRAVAAARAGELTPVRSSSRGTRAPMQAKPRKAVSKRSSTNTRSTGPEDLFVTFRDRNSASARIIRPEDLYSKGEALFSQANPRWESYTRRAAEAGHVEAMNILARRLPDTSLGEALLRRAANRRDVMAMFNLGMLLLDRGDSEGLDWVRQAAERGDVMAMNTFGMRLLDDGEANGINWIREAARRGDPMAIATIQRLGGLPDANSVAFMSHGAALQEIYFGDVPVRNRVARTVIVTNIGGEFLLNPSVRILPADVDGHRPFRIAKDMVSGGGDLAPGIGRQIDIMFAPWTHELFAAELRVASVALSSDAILPLSGRGT